MFKIGYVATIDMIGGGLSYKGTDYHSGGYPFFSNTPVIRTSLENAVSDYKELCNMKNYAEGDKHDFNKVRIHTVMLKEIPKDQIDKAAEEVVIKKANESFTDVELEILKKFLLKKV